MAARPMSARRPIPPTPNGIVAFPASFPSQLVPRGKCPRSQAAGMDSGPLTRVNADYGLTRAFAGCAAVILSDRSDSGVFSWTNDWSLPKPRLALLLEHF